MNLPQLLILPHMGNIELLGGLKQEYGISVLLVSHDLKVIQSMAEDICVMYAGYVVEQGPAEEV